MIDNNFQKPPQVPIPKPPQPPKPPQVPIPKPPRPPKPPLVPTPGPDHRKDGSLTSIPTNPKPKK